VGIMRSGCLDRPSWLGSPKHRETMTHMILADLALKLNFAARLVVFDDYGAEGFVNDNTERTYPNLNAIEEYFLWTRNSV
jgi:hypothetical protein